MTTAIQPQQRPLFEYDLQRDLVSGTFAGISAGAIMALVLIAAFPLFLDRPAYLPVQAIGALAFGDAAIAGGFHPASFVTGLILHLAVAAIWAIPFTLLINRIEHIWMNAFAVGLAIALVAKVVDDTFLVPMVMNALHGHDLWGQNVPNDLSWVAHVIYGVSLLLFLPLRKQLLKGRPGK